MTVVVFGAEKGGVGKTSLALNFTALASAARVDVVLLDTDRQRTATRWLALRAEETSLPAVLGRHSSADPLKDITVLSAQHDLVVVDIGAQNYRALVECAMLADLYVVPSGTSALDLDTTEDLCSLMSRVSSLKAASRLRVRTVLTRVPVHPRSSELRRTQERLAQAHVPMFDAVIAQRSAWRSMANTGRALHELPRRYADVRAEAEMLRLYEEMVLTLQPPRKSPAYARRFQEA